MAAACNNTENDPTATAPPSNKVSKRPNDLSRLFEEYWQARMNLYPLEATASGDSLHNNQYMGALGDEIHRAIRLVVDVGMHTKT